MNAALRGNGTLAVDSTKPELRNGATWLISSENVTVYLHINTFSHWNVETQRFVILPWQWSPLHVAIVAFVAAPPSQYSSTKVPYNVDEIKGVDYDNEVMPEY